MTGSAAGTASGAAVGDPVHVLLAAVREDLRVGAAAVEPDHDRRATAGGFLQLGQRLRQGDGQPGRFPGHEAHRPPVVGGDVGVRAAPSARPRLLFHPFSARLGAGVGDEVVIDVIHPGQPGRRPASPRRTSAAPAADRCDPRSRPAAGAASAPGSGTARPRPPFSAPGRCLNCSAVAAPSAKHRLTADSSATSPGRASSPAAACRISPAPARVPNACGSIAPAYRDETVTGPAGRSRVRC